MTEVAVLIVLSAFVAVPALRAWNDRRVAHWEQAARGWGGTYELRRLGLVQRAHRVVARLQGLPLVISQEGRGPTRLVLAAPALGPARLALARDRLLPWWQEFAGEDVVVVGDEVFDERFKIVSDVPARARLWLDLEVRRALRVLYGWRLRVADGQLRLEHDDTLAPLEQLLAAGRAALLLATSEDRWRERWHDVAPFLDARRVGAATPRLEATVDGTLVSVEPIVTGAEAFVRVRAELARAEGAPELHLPGADPDRDALERAVAEVAARARHESLGPYR